MPAQVETDRRSRTPNLDSLLKVILSEQRIYALAVEWERQGRSHTFGNRDLQDPDTGRIYNRDVTYREKDYCGVGNRTTGAKFIEKWENESVSHSVEIALDLEDQGNPQLTRTEIEHDSENGVRTITKFFGPSHLEQSAGQARKILDIYQELEFRQQVPLRS